MSQVDWPKVAEVGASCLTTLLAAYLGARFAFQLQSKEQDRERASRNVENLNLAISQLIDQIVVLDSFITATDLHTHNSADRHYMIKPLVTANFRPLDIHLDRLSFLLAENPDLLVKLASAQNDQNTTLDLIRQRSDMHYNNLQPAVERLQTRLGGERPPENITELIAQELGPRLDEQLRTITDLVVESVTKSKGILRDMVSKLHAAGKKAYPKQRIVHLAE